MAVATQRAVHAAGLQKEAAAATWEWAIGSWLTQQFGGPVSVCYLRPSVGGAASTDGWAIAVFEAGHEAAAAKAVFAGLLDVRRGQLTISARVGTQLVCEPRVDLPLRSAPVGGDAIGSPQEVLRANEEFQMRSVMRAVGAPPALIIRPSILTIIPPPPPTRGCLARNR